MEFKSLKNIESSFRQIRLFGIVFLSLCAVVTVWSVWNSYRFAEKQREKIYVLYIIAGSDMQIINCGHFCIFFHFFPADVIIT